MWSRYKVIYQNRLTCTYFIGQHWVVLWQNLSFFYRTILPLFFGHSRLCCLIEMNEEAVSDAFLMSFWTRLLLSRPQYTSLLVGLCDSVWKHLSDRSGFWACTLCFLLMSKTDSLAIMPTSHSDWTAVWRWEIMQGLNFSLWHWLSFVVFHLHSWVQHPECLQGESLEVCYVYDFLPRLPVRPFGTGIHTFAFRHDWMTGHMTLFVQWEKHKYNSVFM